MKFPKDFLNKIICGDVLDVMKKIPEGSVDLVITSPPYNIKNSTGNGLKDGRGGKWANAALQKGYSDYDDCMPHDKYAKWQKDGLKEMMRVISEGGAIFYNHKWRVQAGLLQDRQDIVPYTHFPAYTLQSLIEFQILFPSTKPHEQSPLPTSCQ